MGQRVERLQCGKSYNPVRGIFVSEVKSYCKATRSTVVSMLTESRKTGRLEMLSLVTDQYITCKHIITKEFIGASIHIGEVENRNSL